MDSNGKKELYQQVVLVPFIESDSISVMSKALL